MPLKASGKVIFMGFMCFFDDQEELPFKGLLG
jgi:hypothetical protein